ncbi:proton-coupled amino acid transporter-like protein CG1139 isoform X2 [Periplaneta americana]
MDTKSSASKESLSVISLETLNMSSTVKLAGQKDEYDPFEHRQVEHPNSDIGALAHLLKSSLGTGVLAMPMAFLNGGLAFSLAGTIIVGLICTHCVHILVKSSQDLCRREQIPSLGFAETAEVAFSSGPPQFRKFSTAGRKFVNGALLATYYSALCVYIVFVARSIQQVADHYMEEEGIEKIDIRVYIPMLLVALVPISLVRDLKYLVPFSALANVFILVSFAITLYYMFNQEPNTEGTEMIAPAEKIPLFFATVIFAMEGIGVVMPLENSMKKPGHFLGCPGILNIAMFIVVFLYAAIGFFGYLRFKGKVEASVTLNLPTEEVLAQVVKLLYAAAILFSYGLQYYIPTSIAWPNIKPMFRESFQYTAEMIFRVVVCCITVAVAAAVPNLGPIISLVGALCFSTLGLFCPAMIETITCWNTGLGRGNWRLWKNCLIMVFAVCALVAGSYVSILEIIDTY